MSSGEEEMDSIQTEPQDLTMKRPLPPQVDEDDDEEEVVQQKVAKHTDEDADQHQSVCDSTSGDSPATPPKTSHELSELVVNYVKSLYQWNLFWDQMLEDSKSTDTLDEMKKLLESQLKSTTTGANDSKSLANCDNDLKHLLTKLKLMNELYDRSVDRMRSQMSDYKMKDFCKE